MQCTDPLGGGAVPGKLKREMMHHRTPWISFSASLDAEWILELLWEAKTRGLSISVTKLVALSPKSEELLQML